jgi:hypothetical protein
LPEIEVTRTLMAKFGVQPAAVEMAWPRELRCTLSWWTFVEMLTRAAEPKAGAQPVPAALSWVMISSTSATAPAP